MTGMNEMLPDMTPKGMLLQYSHRDSMIYHYDRRTMYHSS
jgi:hypothetical protein